MKTPSGAGTTPVQEELYHPSPAQERYYDKMADSLIEANVGSDGTINDEELHKEITLLKYEKEAEHERNILNMTQVDDYKYPWKDKDTTTVNDTAYKFLNSWNDDESDSSKQVETSKKTIKGTHVHETSVGTPNVDPAVIGVGIYLEAGKRRAGVEELAMILPP